MCTKEEQWLQIYVFFTKDRYEALYRNWVRWVPVFVIVNFLVHPVELVYVDSKHLTQGTSLYFGSSGK